MAKNLFNLIIHLLVVSKIFFLFSLVDIDPLCIINVFSIVSAEVNNFYDNIFDLPFPVCFDSDTSFNLPVD